MYQSPSFFLQRISLNKFNPVYGQQSILEIFFFCLILEITGYKLKTSLVCNLYTTPSLQSVFCTDRLRKLTNRSSISPKMCHLQYNNANCICLGRRDFYTYKNLVEKMENNFVQLSHCLLCVTKLSCQYNISMTRTPPLTRGTQR